MPEPRPATADDLASIEGCAREAYAKYVSRIGRKPAPMVADFGKLIADGNVQVIDAEGGQICGFVVFYPVESSMMLENVAVHPGFQGSGYGRILIDFVERQAIQDGLLAVRLYTNIHMQENIGLYPALGYEETGRRSEEGFDRVFFEKRL